MSAPEYDQRAEDHRAILILLRVLNDQDHDSSNADSSKRHHFWNAILQQVEQIEEIRISEPGLGYERVVRLRFKRHEYPLVNHEWGDFQAHRRLYGLLSFGLIGESIVDSSRLYERHTTTAQSYAGLLDSRCFLLTPDRTSVHIDQTDATSLSSSTNVQCTTNDVSEPNNNSKRLESNGSYRHDDDTTIVSKDDHGTKGDTKGDTQNESDEIGQLSNDLSSTVVLSNSGAMSNGHSNRASQCINLTIDPNDSDELVPTKLIDSIRREIQSLIASIFYVLESKRLDKSFEKQDRVPLLLAPFESKSLVGVDQDAKILKKKSLARMRKNMGDLCLLIGSPAEALSNYAAAVEQLRSSQDLLWLSAALEGQCIASLALLNSSSVSAADTMNSILSPPPDPPPESSTETHENGVGSSSKSNSKRTPLQRIFSIPTHRVRPILNDATSSGASTSGGGENSDSKGNYSRSARNNLTHRFAQTTQAGQARSLPSSLDPMLVKLLGKSLLSTSEELFERYKEACCHYAKFKLAAVIELECSFKAARVLTKRGKFLLASEFLQNSVFIVCGRNTDEQIKRLEMVAELYESIGFKRKSSFYRRFSALKTISSGLDKDSWERCYYLLMPALPGYQLNLDSIQYTLGLRAKRAGWIGIHVQLLQELATMSRRMGCETLTQRHVVFLLQCLFEHLTVPQRVELARQLISLKTRTANSSDMLPEYKHLLHPNSVSLFKFPLVTRFELLSPPGHLRPHRLTCLKKDPSLTSNLSNSPFIFTPMQLHRPNLNRRRSQPFVQTTDFCWVAGELCHVNLHLLNPLPCELQISEMALLFEPQSHFQSEIISETMQPETGPVILKLSGVPQTPCTLELVGYSSLVFGLNSECKLVDLPPSKKTPFPSKYSIEIVPPLPLLSMSLQSVGRFKATNENELIADTRDHKLTCSEEMSVLSIQLYAGESRVVRMQLTNCSSNGQLIELVSGKIVTSLLPSIRDQVLKFDCDQLNRNLPIDRDQSIEFDLPLFAHAQFSLSKASSSSVSNSRPESPQPVPTTKRQLNSIGSTLANFLNELQATPKMMTKFTQEASPIRDASQVVSPSYQEYAIAVDLEYSGGSGLVAGYGRKHTVKIDVKVLPSLVITRWDVLPAETPDHCYLVFDVLNSTEFEMELEYSEQKSIIIEAGETCRIPVPVVRCMLPQSGFKVDLNQICRQHLKSQVRLCWTILNNSIER
jgi:hypothetical protein